MFSRLQLLGQSVQYPANAIIFGMFEGFYVEPSAGVSSCFAATDCESINQGVLVFVLFIDMKMTRKEYDIGSSYHEILSKVMNVITVTAAEVVNFSKFGALKILK